MSYSIKCPGLKFSKMSQLNNQYHLRKNYHTVSFISSLLSLLNELVWNLKKSIKQPVLSFITNSRSLKQPGLIIQTLE